MASCPTCRKPLAIGPTPLGDNPVCASCEFVWVTEPAMEEFQASTKREYLPSDLERLKADIEARKAAIFDEKVTYYSCPGCDKQMLRRNFGKETFLLVHYCASHGFWMSLESAEAAADYVRRGGELLELRRLIEDLEAEGRRLEIKAAEADRRARSAGAHYSPFFFG